jgi:hypothetical protein
VIVHARCRHESCRLQGGHRAGGQRRRPSGPRGGRSGWVQALAQPPRVCVVGHYRI